MRCMWWLLKRVIGPCSLSHCCSWPLGGTWAVQMLGVEQNLTLQLTPGWHMGGTNAWYWMYKSKNLQMLIIKQTLTLLQLTPRWHLASHCAYQHQEIPQIFTHNRSFINKDLRNISHYIKKKCISLLTAQGSLTSYTSLSSKILMLICWCCWGWIWRMMGSHLWLQRIASTWLICWSIGKWSAFISRQPKISAVDIKKIVSTLLL